MGSHPYYEVIYIDDGSDDKSYDILSKMHKKDKKVKVIKFWKNAGQTAAMRAEASTMLPATS